MNRRDEVAAALERLAPRLPDFEADAALARALASPGLRGAIPETAAWLALVAYARHFVLDDLNAVLAEWGVRRRVSDEPEDETQPEV